MATIVIGENTGNTSGMSDTKADSTAATTNYSSNATLVVRRAAGDSQHTFFQFDISAVDVSVNSAILSVYLQNTATTGYTQDYFRIIRIPTITQLTWNEYVTSSSWTTGGGDGSGTDREATAVASYVATGSDGSSYINIDVTAAVQAAKTAGHSVCTIMVQRRAGDTNFNSAPEISSSETSDGQRPYVTIDSDAGSSAPVRTLMLLGVG